MAATKLDKRRWNTYATYGYTHDVANDQRSAGGVHLHQVRCHNGKWQHRICQSNGTHQAYGPVLALGEAEGEANFARAKQDA